MKFSARVCQALSLVFNDLCLFVISISAAFQRPNNGGEGGIRTLDTLSSIPVFKTGAFNRSATSPDGPGLS
jgi:hypothetical protein